MTATFSIVGGYLGAGKSTLINALLRGALPGRTAVIVNDFGSVNIDADLIASADGDTIALTNGCICCQISTEMVDTMSALAARGDLEHVVCEVSGVGDPGQMARWRSYPGFAPGPVVVCVDATRARRLLRDEYVGDVARRQVAAAEVLLVTKIDLATEAEVSDAIAACREWAPTAPIHLRDPDDPAAALRALLSAETPRPSPQHRAAGARPAPWTSASEALDHADLHRSVTVECREPVDPQRLGEHLGTLATDLVRAKGTVCDVAGVWHEVQLSDGRVEVRPRASRDRPAGASALVLIAAGPDAAQRVHRAAAALSRFAREPVPAAP